MLITVTSTFTTFTFKIAPFSSQSQSSWGTTVRTKTITTTTTTSLYSNKNKKLEAEIFSKSTKKKNATPFFAVDDDDDSTTTKSTERKKNKDRIAKLGMDVVTKGADKVITTLFPSRIKGEVSPEIILGASLGSFASVYLMTDNVVVSSVVGISAAYISIN